MRTKRRAFLKSSALAVGAASVSPLAVACKQPVQETPEPHLKLAGYLYTRMEGIMKGEVQIGNFTHDFSKGGISDLNTEMFSGDQMYDVSEVGLHPFILAYGNDKFRDYMLLPIFPLRVFRHKSIFIHADSGISSPADLKGKRVATAGFASTSLTWIRGILKDEYGIDPSDMEWVISNADSAAGVSGKVSAQEQSVSDKVNVSAGPEGKDESDLLVEREVDVVFHAAEPKHFVQGHPKVKRLFEDSRAEEQGYFTKTGVFPIMHAVAIKRSLVENNTALAKQVFDAYSKSKAMNYAYMRKLAWAFDSLPWYTQEYEETRNVMGENFWTYGIEPNRKALDLICSYSYDQGFLKKQLNYEDLFHPESLTFTEG